MRPSTETMMTFYEQLGRVFYGVAHADGTVRKEEEQRLDELVKTIWLANEDTEDGFGSDAAYQIEIVFNWLNENDWSQQNILSDFRDYMDEHPHLFDKNRRQLIMETAEFIADSFHHMNKKEVKFLTELGHILT